MIHLKTPNGLDAFVPETRDEDETPSFASDAEFADYFKANGYAVARSVISTEICDQLRSLWDSEVKPYPGHIYRQATAKAERHILNDKGWVMNPILNLQSIDPRAFPKLREKAEGQIFRNTALTRLFQTLLGNTPKFVQSMYFEGNSKTWEHQDSYYLDSEHLGSMVGAWIALEDISATAGRFFVCPETHKLDWKRQGKDDNVADSHEVYIQSVVNIMKERKAKVVAPALQKGDVLFWNAYTIHGSLDSEDTLQPRSSITCHAIALDHKFAQHQVHVADVPFDLAEGVSGIHRPKDLAKLRNRAIFWVESHLPGPFYALKRFAIRHRFKN